MKTCCNPKAGSGGISYRDCICSCSRGRSRRSTTCRCPWASTREIAGITRLIAEARAYHAAIAPTAAATAKFLARHGTAFPGTVWVGGCENWYTSRQPTPVLWPFPQSEHKAFFAAVPTEDFHFIPTGHGD